MSESRTRAADNGEESHQWKASFSILSAEAIHVEDAFSAVFFPGKSARLVIVDCVFFF